MNILNYSPHKTFQKKPFDIDFDLKKIEINKNILFKQQNSNCCYKNKNSELIVQISDTQYIKQPKTIDLKRNFFLSLKKNYNNNFLYSTVLSKHLYKIRFKHILKYIFLNKQKQPYILGRIFAINKYKRLILNIAFQGCKVPINLFDTILAAGYSRSKKKIFNLYLNKIFHFSIKNENNKKQTSKFKISRKGYFLN